MYNGQSQFLNISCGKMRCFSSFLFFRPVMFSLSEGEEEEEIKEREERAPFFQKDFLWLSNPTVEERFIMWGRISLQTPKSIWHKNSEKSKKTFFSSSPCLLGRARIAMTFCNTPLPVSCCDTDERGLPENSP